MAAAINIIIQSVEDAKKGKPIIANIERSNIVEAESLSVGILEKGTVAGQTTLMFILKNKDGKVIIAECTGNQFEMMIGAYRGAVHRFGK